MAWDEQTPTTGIVRIRFRQNINGVFYGFVKFVLVLFCWTVSTSTAVNAHQEKQTLLFDGQIAPQLKGMGTHDVPISSKYALAYTFFNQAIALTYGFNHLEAERSYKQVALLDPQSAIAYWGQYLVLGPNINGPMEVSAVTPVQNALNMPETRYRFKVPLRRLTLCTRQCLYCQ